MSLIICTECGKEFSDKAISCPNCGCPTGSHKNNQIVVNQTTAPAIQDKVSRDEVVKHLSYAAYLEKTIFTYQNAFSFLQQKINSLGHRKHIKRPKDLEMSDFAVSGWFFLLSFALALLFLCANGGDFISDLICILTVVLMFFNEDLLARVGIALAIAAGATLVLFIINLIIKITRHIKEKTLYKSELEKDNKRVEKENKKIEKLRQQQRIITRQIDVNQSLLKKLYSLDIIFPKYRHMVAVITMLEYFESGRCSCLTGAHGAYDTYSYEEKQNIIIGKLDVVISMLNDIRKTQYMLYEAIQEANDTASRIYEQSERMIESNSKIADNVALTAYNTDIIRQNTAISTYIDVFS